MHGDDPKWIAPIRAADMRDLTGQGTFGQYAQLQMFLCEDEGRVLGRLAAIYNPRLPGTGQIGYFESVDDPQVLGSLLEVACPWLKARGATEIWGPMNGGAHRTHRFMTKGFETEPFLFEPRNPSYYPSLFEANGFEAFKHWHSYELSASMIQTLVKRLARAVKRAADRHTIVPFEMKAPDLPRLHGILDRVWTGHPGYAPMQPDEFLETYGGLVAITVAPYLGVVENAAGADIAIGLCYPDFAEEVRALRGDASGWAAWMGQGLPNRLIMHTVAVVPEERGAGPSMLIIDHAAKHLAGDGFDQVVVALVVDTFKLFSRFAKPTRDYALYRRDPDLRGARASVSK